MIVIPAYADEVDGCNSQRVKDMILGNTFAKMKSTALKMYSDGQPGPNTPRILSALNVWTGAIENVRQLSYDPQDNIRYCAADFEYHDTPSTYLMPLMFNDPTCAKSFTYKIEALLDQPGQIYTSWSCTR